MLRRSRIALPAFRRCLTSRYDEGSSNMYTSAFWQHTTAMAKRWSSPPDSASTSRSHTCARSSSSRRRGLLPSSSLESRTFSTLPLTALGMWSTYCGLMIALRSSSRMRVK
mmetsp:Transcript_51396/g.164325  ORF Transcript_51396/g.164325 Transcript_51396/m.164325 type:complete len:111 (-) Transcript_51396:522-854(-)